MPHAPSTLRLALACGAAAWCLAAGAQTISLSGSLGSSKALLVIDGQPHTLAVGASVQGVTLKRVGDGEAEIELDGRTRVLRLGSPVRVGAVAPPPATEIVIPAGPGGHFTSPGSINGRPVRFLVDTGATLVAISQGEATRIGLDWQRGRPGLSQTAGGVVPVHKLNLTSVRVGGVEVYNVDAVVVPAEMPMVLLGNSFLSRFAMRRDQDILRLEKR